MAYSRLKQQVKRGVEEFNVSDFTTVKPNGTVIRIGAARFLGISIMFALAWCLLYTAVLSPYEAAPLRGNALRVIFQVVVVFSVFVGWVLPKHVSAELVGKRGSLIAYVFFLAGCLLTYGASISFSIYLYIVGIVLISAAYTWFVFLWGCIFRFLDARQAARIIMLAFVVSAFIFLVIAFLSSPMSLIVFVLLPAISLAMAFSCMHELPEKPRVIDIGTTSDRHQDIVLFAALFSFACGYALSQRGPYSSEGSGTTVLFTCIVVVFAALLFVDSLTPHTRGKKSFKLAVSALAVIGGLLLLNTLPAHLGALPLTLVTLATLGVDSLFWSELATMAGETHTAAFRLFCKNLLTVQLGKLGGVLLGLIANMYDGLHIGSETVSSLVAYAIIICVVAIWWLNARRFLDSIPEHQAKECVAVNSDTDTSNASVEAGASSRHPHPVNFVSEKPTGNEVRPQIQGAQGLDASLQNTKQATSTATLQEKPEPEAIASSHAELCHLISSSHGLTPREEEIFCLLAKGRNASYIQKELYLSLGTAKTHIRHIYRKLDVHSKQELLDLLEKYSA